MCDDFLKQTLAHIFWLIFPEKYLILVYVVVPVAELEHGQPLLGRGLALRFQVFSKFMQLNSQIVIIAFVPAREICT